jgi:hypothetical protein
MWSGPGARDENCDSTDRQARAGGGREAGRCGPHKRISEGRIVHVVSRPFRDGSALRNRSDPSASCRRRGGPEGDHCVLEAAGDLRAVVEQARALGWTKDPFDRLIVVHALSSGALLVTADDALHAGALGLAGRSGSRRSPSALTSVGAQSLPPTADVTSRAGIFMALAMGVNIVIVSTLIVHMVGDDYRAHTAQLHSYAAFSSGAAHSRRRKDKCCDTSPDLPDKSVHRVRL